MYEERVTALNNLEKKSFYSFLSLYLISSLIFLLVSAYWYYSAQKASFEQNDYYALQHKADTLSQKIITTYMQGKPLPYLPPSKIESIAFIDTNNTVVAGRLWPHSEPLVEGYHILENGSILVSSAPQRHHNIAYVVVTSPNLGLELLILKTTVIVAVGILFGLILAIAWILSKIFMRPIHQKVQQIEQFIQDISHELNTPITALQMSSKRALQKKVYDEKILTNISISTKQLYSIYQSLVYLNFSTPKQKAQPIDLKPLLEETITFYTELTQAKHIKIETQIQASTLTITPERARLLFSNLLSNAIKYSMPETTITITLKKGYFSIQDEGVGINNSKLKEIFKPYERSSDIAGGFGVGLSIVAQICQEFDLEIDVVSQLQKGSTFTLRWNPNASQQ